MKLSEIVKFLEESGARPSAICSVSPDITNVFSDSRQVLPGSLFCCITGDESDGHKFADAAQKAGAVALLAERRVESALPQIIVSSVRKCMGKISAKVYGEPSKKLKMFAVTGTNGKTTTTWIIRSLLEAAGEKCGIIGTIIQYDGLSEWDAERTTPESCDVQRLLANMVSNECSACVMETSSHGLYLGRLDGCEFDVMSFTNLNPEHLDFHKDMETYFSAKKLLFDRHSKPNGRIVANADDGYGKRLIADYADVISFGLGDSRISARNLKFSLEGTKFDLYVDGKNAGEVMSPLVGGFNVKNALGAIASVYSDNIELSALKEGLAKAPQVPGRLEKHFIPIGDDIRAACCIIDFAHTPEALKNVLSAAREFCKGSLISVFGHGGGRYQANREALGKIAASLADKIIVTMDNPRNEPPIAIAKQIADGARAEKPGVGLRIILNRSEAIKAALDSASPGDVVVLSGKGPEKYLTVENQKIPYSDAGEVEKIINTGTYIPIPCRLALDSRDVAKMPGCGFVAIVGERTDGHLYIGQAINDGAGFIVGNPGKKPADMPAHIPYIAFEDIEKELAKLARQHMERVRPSDVIAITGSVGKTTTREATKRVLEKKYRVHSAERSFNTIIGCAVSILAMPKDTDVLLLEFGANKPGEILELTKFFPPTFSVITEVAPVHLEGFKTLEGVLSGKMEITQSENIRTFLYNNDNPLLCEADVPVKTVSVGYSEDSLYRIICESEKYSIPLNWEIEHEGNRTSFSADLWGKHLIGAMSIAAAIGMELGVHEQAVSEGVANYRPLPGRGRIIRKNGRVLIDDAYNANPASMRASLLTFIDIEARGKWAVLGDMRELGESGVKFHRDIALIAGKIERVILIGSLWTEALGENLPRNSVYLDNWRAAGEYLKDKDEWGALLIKGSNSHNMQNLVHIVESGL